MAKSSTGNPNVDVRRQPIYDSRIIENATAMTYDYFKTPYGANEDSRSKTKFDTNVEVAGQTPAKQPFHCTAISVCLWSKDVIAVEDVQEILINAKAYFLFEIRRQVVLEMPLFAIPQNIGPYNTGTVSDVPALTNGVPSQKNVFDLGKRAVTIKEQAPFSVSIQYITAPTVKGTVQLYVFLHGSYASPSDALKG